MAAALSNDLLELESELSKTRARLNRLQKKEKEEAAAPAAASVPSSLQPHQHEHGHGSSINNAGTAADLWKRAREAEDNLEFITLERNVAKLLGDIIARNSSSLQENSADVAAGVAHDVGGEGDIALVARANETSTALGLLLLQHKNNNINNTQQYYDNGKSGQFYTALVQWYTSFYNSARCQWH